jgi:hypothetical protein
MADSIGPLNSSAPTTSQLVGAVYNAVSPTPADKQALALQADANGNLKVNVIASVGGGGASSNVNLIQVGGVAISEGQKAMAASLPVVIASDQSAVPVSGTVAVSGTVPVSGTVTAVQPTGTNLHVVADTGSTTAVTGNVTVVQPTGTNLHTVIDSGTTVVTQATAANLNATVVGGLTNNNAAPTTTNVGVLPALANAAAPTWTEGDQVLMSVTLGGAQRSTMEANATVTLATTTYSGSIGAVATAVKASAGRLYGWEIFNNNVGFIYVQFFNLGTGSITLGTTAPFFSLGIPAGSAANVFSTIGIGFSTAISFATTTTRAGLTGPANPVDVNFWYF